MHLWFDDGNVPDVGLYFDLQNFDREEVVAGSTGLRRALHSISRSFCKSAIRVSPGVPFHERDCGELVL